MTWLLWREYRLNRWILATGAVLILLPYALAVVMDVDQDFFSAWAGSSLFAYLTVALLAGNAMAGERADRSAEFIAYLPLSRWRVLASKWLLFLITFAVMWVVSLWGANQVMPPVEIAHLVDVRGFVICGFYIYGVGWLFTSFLSSPIYASTMVLLTSAVLYGGAAAVAVVSGFQADLLNDKEAHEVVWLWSAVIMLSVAIVCFGIGTWNYLRVPWPRSSPVRSEANGSKQHVMTWLLWREYRLNRFILATAAALLLLPYVVAVSSLLMDDSEPVELFTGAWIWSGLSSVLSVALLGGNAIAGERADRSAEFVAYLPLRRWWKMAGKLHLCLATVAVIWAFHLFIRTVLLPGDPVAGMRWLTICFVVTFGVSWLFSSFQSSPVFASTMGFVANVAIWTCIAALYWATIEEPAGYVPNLVARNTEQLFVWYAVIGLPVGIVCFGVGIRNYLRRSEP